MGELKKSKDIAQCIYKAISEKVDTEIKVLNVRDITTLADIFVIVAVPNSRLAVALSDEIEEKLAKEGYLCTSKEGYRGARWILLDCQGVMVHIFHQEEADFYQLDRLWSDGKVMDLTIK